MSKPFVLAHLSDPHLGPLPQPGMRELASKRLVGYINWRHGRHRAHRRDALDAITRDIHATQPDHLAVTGDLVNIALQAEFTHARRWLETLGRPVDVSVVPGNHDAYVAAAGLHRDRHWLPYMAGDDALRHAPSLQTRSAVADCDHSIDGPKTAHARFRLEEVRRGGTKGLGAEVPESSRSTQDPSLAGRRDGSAAQQSDRSQQRPISVGGGEKIIFPYLRRRGPVGLVGVSTAIPTPPFMATGKVGEQQIACVAKMLDDLRAENLFRVVMIHHPPLPSARHKCLVDAVAFQRALAATGAELIIHGHDHVHSLTWIAGNGARVPVIGVPSASASTSAKKRAGAYNLYFIGGGPGTWSCEVVSRGLRPSGAVAELNRFALSWS
jgi:3',5'-cyclic AMP phosphodiesterase CpdA